MIANKRIIITAGPTYELIDPVRFIGNFSSGKMGFALAEELTKQGAQVTLIAGPVSLKCNSAIKRIDVVSAADMYNAAVAEFANCDAAIMCAAVADYTPVNTSQDKMKRKDGEELIIRLKPTQDIAAALGQIKKDNQCLVGFALETNDEAFNAQKKLQKKNLDFIVLNSLNDAGAGFAHDTNKITIFDNDNTKHDYQLKPKQDVAIDIIAFLASKLR